MITPTNSNGGWPLVASTIAQSAGIIKIKRPSGLSQRKSRKIALAVDSGGDSGRDSIILVRSELSRFSYKIMVQRSDWHLCYKLLGD
jgi:hypothetical protein